MSENPNGTEGHGEPQKGNGRYWGARPPEEYRSSWFRAHLADLLKSINMKEDKKIGNGVIPLDHPDGGRMGD